MKQHNLPRKIPMPAIQKKKLQKIRQVCLASFISGLYGKVFVVRSMLEVGTKDPTFSSDGSTASLSLLCRSVSPLHDKNFCVNSNLVNF